ncbi:MAG: hypothetical protein WD770_02715 [Actinomycetota bacterium]
MADQAERGGADEDLARVGLALQAGRDVDGIPQHQGVPGFGRAGDDLPGVDAGPDLDADAVEVGELLVEPSQCALDLVGGAHGPQGVVLVQRGDAEHGHHGVPDELLDGSPVALEHDARQIEVPAHESTERLGVQPLGQGRGADDVDEDDGDRSPGLVGGRSSGQRRPAPQAEAGALGVLLLAPGAGAHDGNPTGRRREALWFSGRCEERCWRF